MARLLPRSLAARWAGGVRWASGGLTTHYKKRDRASDARWDHVEMERFADETDLLIVGGGPAGL